MMLAKLPALDPLKIKVFWNKNYGLVTGTRYSLESLDQCGKRVEIKIPKFWRLISMFVEATVGKLVEGLSPSSWIGLKLQNLARLLEEIRYR